MSEREIKALGPIPDEWKISYLGDIGDFKNGISKSSEDFGFGTPFINLQDLFGRNEIDSDEFSLVNASDREIDELHLMSGDVLFVRSSVKPEGVGLPVLVSYIPPGTVYSGFIIRFRPRIKIDKDFLKYCFLEEGFRNRLLKRSTISANTNINQPSLRQLFFLHPPIKEQQRIAKVLGAWDKAIYLTDRLIEVLKQRKKGLMQRLLSGDVRFPDFGFEEWMQYKLGEVFDQRIEKGFPDLPLLSVTDEGIKYRESLNRRDTSSSDKTNYLRICPGDIGYNTMRMWQGRSALSDIEGIVSPAYTVLSAKKSVDARFMAYLFKLPSMIHMFWRYSQGLVSDTLSLKFPTFSKIVITLPSLEEQSRIVEVLESSDLELDLLMKKLKMLMIQKKGLMQRLLTGQVRVKVD